MQTNDLKQKRNMEKEKTERAAIELCTTEGQEEWVKDYGVSCFKDGARWRINSVWHSTDELPKYSGFLAVLMDNGLMETMYYNVGIRFSEMNLKGYVLWAYVSDLLPERKEVAR